MFLDLKVFFLLNLSVFYSVYWTDVNSKSGFVIHWIIFLITELDVQTKRKGEDTNKQRTKKHTPDREFK